MRLISSAAGAYYSQHRVGFASGGTKRAHVPVLSLQEGPKLRLRAYCNVPQPITRRIEARSNSWWNAYGKSAGALAVVSGTFFNLLNGRPFGDVIGPLGSHPLGGQDTKTTYDGKVRLLSQLHRCFVAYHTNQQRFVIGARVPQDTVSALALRFQDYMGGGGWLVHQGIDALSVSQANYDQRVFVGPAILFGQEFQSDVYQIPWSSVAAVSRSGKQIALVITEGPQSGSGAMTLAELSQWFRGQAVVPGTTTEYRFPFPVSNACFYDGGGTAEMYLPKVVDKARQKKQEQRQWGKKGNRKEERAQPTCWMVIQVP